MESKDLETQAFRPELLSRRGEVTAWVLTLILVVVVLVVRSRLPDINLGAYVFLAFFMFSSLSISLGNWMDRQTELWIDDLGIRFKNGLRRSNLAWDQITRVLVSPSRLGDKVHVVGENSHFHFRTMGEIEYQGQTRGRVGFAQGELILETILERSGLQRKDTEDSTREYARM